MTRFKVQFGLSELSCEEVDVQHQSFEGSVGRMSQSSTKSSVKERSKSTSSHRAQTMDVMAQQTDVTKTVKMTKKKLLGLEFSKNW